MKLNKGDVIIFPTDTVYGIGGKIEDIVALEKIYEIKKIFIWYVCCSFHYYFNCLWQ